MKSGTAKHSIDHTVDQDKASIIIAAYNEVSCIKETLALLHTDEGLGHYQLLVVCNGCTDGTEELVINEFPQVLCFNLAKPSKALAIRYAESLNPGFPRIYLDADIAMTAQSAHTLIKQAKAHAAPCLLIPSSKLISNNSAGLVKSFYRTWYNTPHVQTSGYGAGTYVLNKAGRDGFGQWPKLIADDAFVRRQFAHGNIHVTQEANVAVRAPKTVWSLIKVKSRSKLGNLELKAYVAQTDQTDESQTDENQTISASKNVKTNDTAATNLAAEPNTITQPSAQNTWYDQVVYLVINLIASIIAKWQFLTGYKTWQRDDSNR